MASLFNTHFAFISINTLYDFNMISFYPYLRRFISTKFHFIYRGLRNIYGVSSKSWVVATVATRTKGILLYCDLFSWLTWNLQIHDWCTTLLSWSKRSSLKLYLININIHLRTIRLTKVLETYTHINHRRSFITTWLW